MVFIIMAAIAAIVIFIVAGFKKIGGNRGWKPNAKQFLTLFALLLVIPAFFTIVPANSVGILYSPFSGGVQSDVLYEGVQTKGPFDSVYVLSTEVQTEKIDSLFGQTQDSQFLTISIDVKYQVDSAEAVKVFKKFRSLSRVTTDLVKPAAQRAIEEATTKYNIIEILGDRRTDVYSDIERILTMRFANDGITLHSITFLDTDGGEEIEQAIRAEAVAKKAVETAEQERTKAEIEAETRIIQAEAEAKEKRILAEAIAKNPEILELEWIKKWSGVLPIYMSGNDSSVMLDLSSLQDAGASSAAPTE
jgi:regulator of protease activity HflC (stomatin/prohibitin superfamily)